jgi:hypothetical protein
MPFWEFLDPKRIMSCKGKLVKDDISKWLAPQGSCRSSVHDSGKTNTWQYELPMKGHRLHVSSLRKPCTVARFALPKHNALKWQSQPHCNKNQTNRDQILLLLLQGGRPTLIRAYAIFVLDSVMNFIYVCVIEGRKEVNS